MYKDIFMPFNSRRRYLIWITVIGVILKWKTGKMNQILEKYFIAHLAVLLKILVPLDFAGLIKVVGPTRVVGLIHIAGLDGAVGLYKVAGL